MNAALRLFAPPRFLAMSAAGVEISDAFVRAVQLSGSLRNARIEWWAEEPLPQGAVVGGALSNASAVAETLMRIRRAHRFDFAHVSLSEQHTYLFEVTLAGNTTPEEARQAVALRLEEEVPLRGSDAVFDVAPAPLLGAALGAPHRYYAAAAARKTVEAYARVCAEAEFAPLSLESEAAAVARAVASADALSPLLIMHLAEDDAGLYITSGLSPRFSSTVPLIAEAVANEPAALAGETRRVCSFWETRSAQGGNGSTVRRAVACGRGAANARTLSLLSAAMHMPVEPALVWRNVLSVERAAPLMPQNDSLRFAVAVGSALRTFSYA